MDIPSDFHAIDISTHRLSYFTFLSELFPLPRGSTVLREGLHLTQVFYALYNGPRNTFWQNKQLIHKNNSDREMFRQETVCPHTDHRSFFIYFAKRYFLPFLPPIIIIVCFDFDTFSLVSHMILWAHECPPWCYSESASINLYFWFQCFIWKYCIMIWVTLHKKGKYTTPVS